jgi:hypothetical protein
VSSITAEQASGADTQQAPAIAHKPKTNIGSRRTSDSDAHAVPPARLTRTSDTWHPSRQARLAEAG